MLWFFWEPSHHQELLQPQDPKISVGLLCAGSTSTSTCCSCCSVAPVCCLQGGPVGVLPGHVAAHLQRPGAPPRPDEGQQLEQLRVHPSLTLRAPKADPFPWKRCVCCCSESHRLYSVQRQHAITDACDWPAPEPGSAHLPEQHQPLAHSQ